MQLAVTHSEMTCSDSVLHMSQIILNELSSCDVQLLIQCETANRIWIASAILHALSQLGILAADRWLFRHQTSHELNQMHNVGMYW